MLSPLPMWEKRVEHFLRTGQVPHQWATHRPGRLRCACCAEANRPVTVVDGVPRCDVHAKAVAAVVAAATAQGSLS